LGQLCRPDSIASVNFLGQERASGFIEKTLLNDFGV